MKTIKDIEFKPHNICESGGSGLHGIMHFENGYGISVVRFKFPPTEFYGTMSNTYGSYTNNENEWEVAVLKDGHLCYDSGITDDVMGHLSDDEVTEVMKKIQELKKGA